MLVVDACVTLQHVHECLHVVYMRWCILLVERATSACSFGVVTGGNVGGTAFGVMSDE